MSDFQRVDTSRQYVAISRELKMTPHPARRGPEQRTDGLTVGIVELSRDPRGESAVGCGYSKS